MRSRPLLLVAALASLIAAACTGSSPAPAAPPGALPRAPRALDRFDPGPADTLAWGARLYDDHCAVCHGVDGAADGPASAFLFPEARDFTRGRFRLVGTANGVPSRSDLVRTLRRGVPGSSMPAWSWMEDEDLEALADFVHELAKQGVAHELAAGGMPQLEAWTEATARTTPGPELPRVAAVDATEAVLSRGRSLYLSNCAACHGPDGTGNPEPRYDEDGTLNWPRDYTAGYLKGGRRAHELGWRIQAGLPGSAMPATDLAPEDLEALVAYLQSEIPEDARTHLVHRRAAIRAPFLERLPEAPDDPAWADVGETFVVLSPLFAPTLGGRVTRAHVAAAHDGNDVAVRVRWHDASSNRHLTSDVWEPDACALQFTEDERPRLFGMGASGHQTNIWHWKALRLTELGGAVELFEAIPHVVAHAFRGEVYTDVPLYRPLLDEPAPSGTVDSLAARGIGEVDGGEDVGGVRAVPRYWDGQWTVTFVRSCVPTTEGEVAILPGEPLNVALAIWNGEVADRGARKSISIWQQLVLEDREPPPPMRD